VLVGLWVRLSIEESPLFAEAKAAREAAGPTRAPIIEVLRNYPREVLIAMGLRIVENIGYYLFSIVVLTYLVTYQGMPPLFSLLDPCFIGSSSPSLAFPECGPA
jgi:hypothetical protein